MSRALELPTTRGAHWGGWHARVGPLLIEWSRDYQDDIDNAAQQGTCALAMLRRRAVGVTVGGSHFDILLGFGGLGISWAWADEDFAQMFGREGVPESVRRSAEALSDRTAERIFGIGGG